LHESVTNANTRHNYVIRATVRRGERDAGALIRVLAAKPDRRPRRDAKLYWEIADTIFGKLKHTMSVRNLLINIDAETIGRAITSYSYAMREFSEITGR
jgi:hypothetical protein